jgi:broad specificity phosphatase PhoE
VRRVLIIRHAQSEWNAVQRWQGWIDVPLNAIGEDQARARGRELADAAVTVPTVFTSDLARARRTAELVAEAIGAKVVVDERFRERHGGEWQGRTAAEIDEEWPGWREQWRRRELTAPPGGESDDEVIERFDIGLAHIASATSDGTDAIVVTHGGMLRLVAVRAGVHARDVVENVGGCWFRYENGTLVAEDPLRALATDDTTATE